MRRCGWALCTLFFACSPSPPQAGVDAANSDAAFSPDPCKASLAAGASAKLTVGKGQLDYADLAMNEALTWEKGPQGGHHIWLAVRQTGLRLHATITTIGVDDLDAFGAPLRIMDERVVYDFRREEGGYCTLAGLRAQLDLPGAPPLSSLENHHLLITVTDRDLDGATATNTAHVIVSGALD